MIFAGMWQLRRLDQRRDANAEFIERIEQTPVPLESLLAADLDPDAVANRRVTASGTYLPDQVVLFKPDPGWACSRQCADPYS